MIDIRITHCVQLPNSWEVVSRGISFVPEIYKITGEYKCASLPFAIAGYPLVEEIMFNDHDDGIRHDYPGSPLLPKYDGTETIIAGLQPEIMAFTCVVVQNFK